MPVIALVRTQRIRNLELRLAGVEAALLRLIRERQAAEAPPQTSQPVVPPEPLPPAEPRPASAPAVSVVPAPSAQLETVIGQRWLGWIAVLLIFFAAAFFLKYAFENCWIGELGRVMLGILAGIGFTWAGHALHHRGWRVYSRVLTAGGIALLYLSVYAAFGFYHLLEQRSAFLFLAIVVAEAHLLASLYNARSIAAMALVGGFLVPALLSTGRDQHLALFSYILALDLGMLWLVLRRGWKWVGSLAFAGSHMLFWAWYEQHYHPEKLAAALGFQAAVFLLFSLADLAPALGRGEAGAEEWTRSVANPFVFYATCYSLLREDYRDWMGALAIGMAMLYAARAQIEIKLRTRDRRMLLVALSTALTFVTLAIPIQLKANWITIGWAAEALTLAWVGVEMETRPLRLFSNLVFGLTVVRLFFLDTPWNYRPAFTPVLNRYFLAALAVAASLVAAAVLYRRLALRSALTAGLFGAAVLWLGSSVETYTYFDALAANLRGPRSYEAVRHLRWTGQMALSLLWSAYAAALTLAGFRLRVSALRSAGLALFGLTLVKVVLLDMSQLRQLYRIVAVLALGVVLLGVAWAYQKLLRRESEAGRA
ncbi:MAG: DUF2339 domain-containing protein [Acidobacteria bacterium]|nr:DUF2339 domain-containing protein [Acidobacteriota bacterium]